MDLRKLVVCIACIGILLLLSGLVVMFYGCCNFSGNICFAGIITITCGCFVVVILILVSFVILQNYKKDTNDKSSKIITKSYTNSKKNNQTTEISINPLSPLPPLPPLPKLPNHTYEQIDVIADEKIRSVLSITDTISKEEHDATYSQLKGKNNITSTVSKEEHDVTYSRLKNIKPPPLFSWRAGLNEKQNLAYLQATPCESIEADIQ